MKSISKLFLGLALVSTGAFAATDVAPVLRSLKVVEVGKLGKVVQTQRSHPFTKFVIAIPAKVEPGDACTDFVGQTTTAKAPKRPVLLTAVGATSPLTQACIQIAVMPVDTNLTVEMNVLTGGFVPANPRQVMLVEIAGAGTFRLELDLGSDRVKIDRVFTK